MKRLLSIIAVAVAICSCNKPEVDLGYLTRGGWWEVLPADSQWISAEYHFVCNGSTESVAPGRLTIIRRADMSTSPQNEVVDYRLDGYLIELPEGSYTITKLDASVMQWVSRSGNVRKSFKRMKTED